MCTLETSEKTLFQRFLIILEMLDKIGQNMGHCYPLIVEVASSTAQRGSYHQTTAQQIIEAGVEYARDGETKLAMTDTIIIAVGSKT